MFELDFDFGREIKNDELSHIRRCLAGRYKCISVVKESGDKNRIKFSVENNKNACQIVYVMLFDYNPKNVKVFDKRIFKTN